MISMSRRCLSPARMVPEPSVLAAALSSGLGGVLGGLRLMERLWGDCTTIGSSMAEMTGPEPSARLSGAACSLCCCRMSRGESKLQQRSQPVTCCHKNAQSSAVIRDQQAPSRGTLLVAWSASIRRVRGGHAHVAVSQVQDVRTQLCHELNVSDGSVCAARPLMDGSACRLPSGLLTLLTLNMRACGAGTAAVQK